MTSQPDITPEDDPSSYLCTSDSDSSDGVRTIEVDDKGSHPRRAPVEIQGVPALGLVDSGADITIIGPDLFKKVAATARLKKKDFKPANKSPRTYTCEPFALHGRMDLEISFGERMIRTPVFVKMDAHDPLLLSEGVCRQLGIISYHPDVLEGATPAMDKRPEEAAQVPVVRVCVLQSLSIPSGHSSVIPVHVEQVISPNRPLLLEYDPKVEAATGLRVEDSLIQPNADGLAFARVANVSRFNSVVSHGTPLGEAVEADTIPPAQRPAEASDGGDREAIRRVTADQAHVRKEKLLDLVGGLEIPEKERRLLCGFLADHHEAFCLEEGERGETDIIQMEIDTGDAAPKRQPLRRMPFAARQEVANQLQKMQDSGVITPSKSPWASPVVLVRKKDGSLRFCIDYRALNSVTKADTFPLPRIDDLLDQLGRSKYFSTLDLASGFWQIKVHPKSREKTAFVTPQGLYEFKVMPFGLTNAPSVFQRLMEQVVTGLNPTSGPAFVSAYIDDILVFSATIEEHLEHLRRVLKRLKEVGLKLKPVKCRFASKEVEYLGHVITPDGLQPNPKLVSAVKEFPTPRSLPEVRRFLGLASYYRRFIWRFAKIAEPLHQLTCKGSAFTWSVECQTAFDKQKEVLVTAPVLAYPSFDHDFILETDASIQGLGAVLSQKQCDGSTHPVAYASRALSSSEKRYGITELETLAVVWAVSHFHYYLYGHNVSIYTDHTAVQAILGKPNSSGKHARWWSKVFGSGIKDVRITYRAGRENANVDALSRSPQLAAPGDEAEDLTQVAVVHNRADGQDISSLLEECPLDVPCPEFSVEQRRDTQLAVMFDFLERGILPENDKLARKIANQAPSYAIESGVLYYLDTKQHSCKRVLVPHHLRERIMEQYHSGPLGGHFAGNKLYRSLMNHWYWEGMFSDVQQFCKSCPQCVIVSGSGRRNKPPLHPIPVQRPFQIVGVDIMDLPITQQGNKHVVVFQDFFTKWPLVFPVSDQKAVTLVELLTKEVIPFFGVPEALLSDRGTNLLSHLMRDTCALLGIEKLNTTAYHPECNGMVERFNRTLKSVLRKHADKFGCQWDKFLPSVLWGSCLDTTRKGPCQGLDSFLWRPDSSCGNRTNTHWPTLNPVGDAFRS